MPAATGLAACFYSNMARNGSPSRSVLELSQQQNKDMHKLRKSAWPGVCLREVRPIPVWSGTVQTLNRPQTSRALDQQQGPRQHPTAVPAPSREIDAIQRQSGIFAWEDSSCVRCSVTESDQRAIRVFD